MNKNNYIDYHMEVAEHFFVLIADTMHSKAFGIVWLNKLTEHIQNQSGILTKRSSKISSTRLASQFSPYYYDQMKD